VEDQDTPWTPLCSHTLLTQMDTVSCLAGLTTASIYVNLTDNTCGTTAVLWNCNTT
jgi:hypothetical protein